MTIKSTMLNFITTLFIILFAYAAVSKILDWEMFNFQLGRSPFIHMHAKFVGFLVPSTELLISSFLCVSRLRVLGLYMSLYLMTLFSGYIFLLLRFSPYIPCSCGGILSSMTWNQHLVFNMIFVILALFGIPLAESRRNSLSQTKSSITSLLQ